MRVTHGLSTVVQYVLATRVLQEARPTACRRRQGRQAVELGSGTQTRRARGYSPSRSSMQLVGSRLNENYYKAMVDKLHFNTRIVSQSCASAVKSPHRTYTRSAVA